MSNKNTSLIIYWVIPNSMNATTAEWKVSGNFLEPCEDKYLEHLKPNFVYSVASLFSLRLGKTLPGPPLNWRLNIGVIAEKGLQAYRRTFDAVTPPDF